MKLMIPFTPHLAHECLEFLNCNSPDKWPNIRKNSQEEINFAVQINGKTRDIIKIKKILMKKKLMKLLLKSQS